MTNENGKRPTRPAPAKPRSTAKAPQSNRATREREALVEESVRTRETCELTACAWALWVRDRVRELAEELARLNYIMGHPDREAEKLCLSVALRLESVGELIGLMDDAEQVVDRLMNTECTTLSGPPDLAGACRAAGEAYLAEARVLVEAAEASKRSA